MASRSNLICHFVFATKDRMPLIPEDLDVPLHTYMSDILKRGGNSLIIAGGGSDHRHVLARLAPSQTPAQVVRRIKSASSGWLKKRIKAWVGWQTAYFVEAVSAQDLHPLASYIAKQRTHHQATSLADELDRRQYDLS